MKIRAAFVCKCERAVEAFCLGHTHCHTLMTIELQVNSFLAGIKAITSQ